MATGTGLYCHLEIDRRASVTRLQATRTTPWRQRRVEAPKRPEGSVSHFGAFLRSISDCVRDFEHTRAEQPCTVSITSTVSLKQQQGKQTGAQLVLTVQSRQ